MMKRFFAVLPAAALLLTLTACASMGNAVSDAGRGVGNAVSNVGEGAGDLVSGVTEGAGDLVSRTGDAVTDGMDRMRSSASSNRDSLAGEPRNDGAVRDENGKIGDEDYEEAHDGVESFVESHQNRDTSNLTD